MFLLSSNDEKGTDDNMKWREEGREGMVIVLV